MLYLIIRLEDFFLIVIILFIYLLFVYYVIIFISHRIMNFHGIKCCAKCK
jgi:hypothetical protein